jgi:branched-chain amino acid transport system permease protein
MQQFFQQVVSGLADGAIYASLALALVLIYRATEVINFAQGEIGMFTTFIAWSLINHHGFSYWPAFVATLAIAFVFGVGLHTVVIRPLERGSVLTVVMATIALLIVLNGLASVIWGPDVRSFPSPFPNRSLHVGGVFVSLRDIGVVAMTLAAMVLLAAFFKYTKVGLAMRAAAVSPGASRLLGVRVSWMLALGWGLAAVLSALSGMLIAPSVFLDPNMMQTVLIYSFAAAILGGIESAVGAVVGGLALGVGINLLGTYVHTVTPELRLPVALGVLLVVLLVRPAGLFGRAVARRV